MLTRKCLSVVHGRVRRLINLGVLENSRRETSARRPRHVRGSLRVAQVVGTVGRWLHFAWRVIVRILTNRRLGMVGNDRPYRDRIMPTERGIHATKT